MELCSYGLSDVGRRRTLNEDSYLADDELGLYVVADGVGGHAKGEIASAQAVEEIYGFVSGGQDTILRFVDKPDHETLFGVRRLMESAVQAACYMVFSMAEMDPLQRGMSTTISALLVTVHAGIVAQVGDSRVYRIRGGRVTQLTEDHTLVNYKLKHGLITAEEAAQAPGKNVITRAVGHRDYVQVDTSETDVQLVDRFLLCSDGLHLYAEGDALLPMVKGDLDRAARNLINYANEQGGRDNITVLLVDLVS